MQDLVNWQPFNIKTKASYTFDQFIDIIKQLDNNTSPDLWVKWKDYSNQVVVGTPQYYYKLYQTDIQSGTFLAEIRELLGEIYREDYGILWNVKTIIKDNYIYTIEQREKLEVCNENLISLDEMFLKWNITLQKLEKKLNFYELTLQLKNDISNLNNLKLVRDCITKYADYAITKNGDIILLDDADWFIAMVDKDGEWLSALANCYTVITKNGNRIFAPQPFFDINRFNKVNEPFNKWHLFLHDEQHKRLQLNFFNEREQMLANNIKILATNKLLPNYSQTKYLLKKS